MLVKCVGVEKSFGSKKVLNGIDLSLEEGRIIGLLGKNGTGKSTLLKLINDLLTPDKGEILFHPSLVVNSLNLRVSVTH